MKKKAFLFVTVFFVITVFLFSIRAQNSSNEVPIVGQVMSRDFEGMKYHYYIPYRAGASKGTPLPLLVLIHDRGHDPVIYLQRWIQISEEKGVALLAPDFNAENCKDYRALGIGQTRTDFHLLKILDDAQLIWSFDIGKILIYGHGEGAEFVHRLALIYPERILKGAITGTSSYTFPDPATPFPYGTKRTLEMRDINFKLIEFAALDVAIIAGEQDVLPIRGDHASKQGSSHVERAQNFYEQFRTFAEKNKRPCNLQIMVVPQADHNPTDTLPAAQNFLLEHFK
ncbi:MAG: hypothetical protein ACOY3I_05320 [Verrucomicrobiota bacterium]